MGKVLRINQQTPQKEEKRVTTTRSRHNSSLKVKNEEEMEVDGDVENEVINNTPNHGHIKDCVVRVDRLNSESPVGLTPIKSATQKKSTNINTDGRSSPPLSVSSNLENEQQLTTDRTPTGRRRSRRLSVSCSATTSDLWEVKNDPNSINFTLRKTPTPQTPSSVKRELRPRQAIFVDPTIYEVDSGSENSDSDSKKKKEINKTYFTKEDNEEYRPSGGKRGKYKIIEEEDADDASSEEDDFEDARETDSDSGEGEEDDEADEDEEEDGEYEEIPETVEEKSLYSPLDTAQIAVTPKVLQKIEGRAIQRLAVDSPVALGSQTMSPNPENYFLAETRIKYRQVAKNDTSVMNDAMKGKRRWGKKITRNANDRLPDKVPTGFSVTAEAAKAYSSIDSKSFIAGNSHDEDMEALLESYKENEFPHWIGLFKDGFNVMLYGYGSKLSLLRDFEAFVNKDYLVVFINGLFPKLNPRKLLQGLCEYIDSDIGIPHGANIESVARETISLLKRANPRDVYLLINNFDQMVLRLPQMLTALTWLAQLPFIHILASCDTVNAFLGVTQSQALELNFCWVHCPTYRQYREELKWTRDIYGDETKVVTQKSSLKYVLQSLTENARKAFALLAQMQSKQIKSRAVRKSKDGYNGVRFQELAKECREKFLAHSDENLRNLLVEFFDHKLIKQTGKGKHLENNLLIELDIETLEEVISEMS